MSASELDQCPSCPERHARNIRWRTISTSSPYHHKSLARPSERAYLLVHVPRWLRLDRDDRGRVAGSTRRRHGATGPQMGQDTTMDSRRVSALAAMSLE